MKVKVLGWGEGLVFCLSKNGVGNRILSVWGFRSMGPLIHLRALKILGLLSMLLWVIRLFHNYLLNACYVLDTVLGTGDVTVNKRSKYR